MRNKPWLSIFWVCCLGLAFLGAGCGGGGGGGGGNPPPPPPPPPPAITITIAPTSATLEVSGLTQQFTATVQNTTNTAVTWQVQNTPGGDSTVGTVSTSGIYTTPLTLPQPPFCTQVQNGCQVNVKAISQADTTKSATAIVTLTAIQQPSLEWVKFIDFGSTMRDGGLGVALDSQNNIVAVGVKDLRNWEDPVGSGVPNPIGALVSLDPLGNERWRTDFGASKSQISNIARDDGRDQFYFTGVGSVEALFGKINNLGQVLIDPFSKSFQINGQGTTGRLIRSNGTQLFVAVQNSADPFVVILDLTGNIQKYFQVGNLPATSQRGAVIVADKCSVTGMWVASDHIWVSGDRIVAGKLAGYFLERFDLSNIDGLNGVVNVGNDIFGTSIVEDSQGTLYFGGTGWDGVDHKTRTFVVRKLDQQGVPIWQKSWDGDNPNANASTTFFGLAVRPGNGVVAYGNLTEVVGNPKCSTYPNCWDVGLIALGSDGTPLWRLRKDFNSSPWDSPRAAVFDSQGKLIVVGSTVPNPTGNDFTDNRDFLIAKFRVP